MTSRIRDASQSVARAGVNQPATLKRDGDSEASHRLARLGVSSFMLLVRRILRRKVLIPILAEASLIRFVAPLTD